jgi:hypothetical protein
MAERRHRRWATPGPSNGAESGSPVTSASRPVTEQTLGAWVIKCNPRLTALEPMVATRRAKTSWCIADNYRSRLIETGQRVLFWVSAHPRRGIWGAGRITGNPYAEDDGLHVATEIGLFDEPVTAEELATVAELRTMEVFRSPQQANPSWVSRTELEVLDGLLPAAPIVGHAGG